MLRRSFLKLLAVIPAVAVIKRWFAPIATPAAAVAEVEVIAPSVHWADTANRSPLDDILAVRAEAMQKYGGRYSVMETRHGRPVNSYGFPLDEIKCCFISASHSPELLPCSKSADFMLIDGPGPEDFTYACAEHLEIMKSDTHVEAVPIALT